MRMLIENEHECIGGGSGEPEPLPNPTQPPGEIEQIIAQLQHLHDRPGTF